MELRTIEKIVISDSERSELRALCDELLYIEEDAMTDTVVSAVSDLRVAIEEFLENCEED